MKEAILYNLSKDIRGLYCKTKKSSIEDVFVKLAATLDASLYSAFKSAKERMSNMVSNAAVVEAVDALFSIGRKLPENPTVNEVWNVFIKDKGKGPSQPAHYIPYFYTFNQALQNGIATEILSPFVNVLLAVSRVKEEDIRGIDGKAVFEDLQVILDETKKEQEVQLNKQYEDLVPTRRRKPTVREKKTALFASLLRSISNNIASAADNYNLMPLAHKLREGSLMDPDQMALVMNYPRPDMAVVEHAKETLKNILDRENSVAWGKEYFDTWAYNVVVASALNNARYISLDELYDIYASRESAPHPISYMSEEVAQTGMVAEDTHARGEKMNIEDSKWLTPEVIQFLTIFFYLFHRQVT